MFYAERTFGAQVLALPIIDTINPRPPFLPQAIPVSIASRIARLHGHPFVWFLGQILLYLVRPQPSLTADIKQTKKRLGFYGRPIVG